MENGKHIYLIVVSVDLAAVGMIKFSIKVISCGKMHSVEYFGCP